MLRPHLCLRVCACVCVCSESDPVVVCNPGTLIAPAAQPGSLVMMQTDDVNKKNAPLGYGAPAGHTAPPPQRTHRHTCAQISIHQKVSQQHHVKNCYDVPKAFVWFEFGGDQMPRHPYSFNLLNSFSSSHFCLNLAPQSQRIDGVATFILATSAHRSGSPLLKRGKLILQKS